VPLCSGHVAASAADLDPVGAALDFALAALHVTDGAIGAVLNADPAAGAADRAVAGTVDDTVAGTGALDRAVGTNVRETLARAGAGNLTGCAAGKVTVARTGALQVAALGAIEHTVTTARADAVGADTLAIAGIDAVVGVPWWVIVPTRRNQTRGHEPDHQQADRPQVWVVVRHEHTSVPRLPEEGRNAYAIAAVVRAAVLRTGAGVGE
jgi:hypothetical protein